MTKFFEVFFGETLFQNNGNWKNDLAQEKKSSKFFKPFVLENVKNIITLPPAPQLNLNMTTVGARIFQKQMNFQNKLVHQEETSNKIRFLKNKKDQLEETRQLIKLKAESH